MYRSFRRSKEPEVQIKELERRFSDAESERSKRFCSQIREIEFDFRKEANIRHEAEHSRQEAFRKAEIKRRTSFRKQEDLRSEQFEQAHARHEARLRSKEDIRDAHSQTQQAARERMFLTLQEEHSKECERCIQIAEKLFSTGRLQREEMFDRSVDSIIMKLTKLFGIEGFELATSTGSAVNAHDSQVSLLRRKLALH